MVFIKYSHLIFNTSNVFFKSSNIALNDPNFKSRFAKYAKLPPGIGQQQLTEEQINARASQLLSNAGL